TRSRVGRTAELIVPERERVLVGGNAAAEAGADPAGSGGDRGDDGTAATAADPTEERDRRADKLGGAAHALTVLGFLLLLVAVVLRGVAAGRAPWGNMYEFSVVTATVVL